MPALLTWQSELLARLPGGWVAGMGGEWVPKGRNGDYANTRQTDGYALMHVRGGRALALDRPLFFGLENVTDAPFVHSAARKSGLDHSATAGTSAVLLGQERCWQIGLEWAF